MPAAAAMLLQLYVLIGSLSQDAAIWFRRQPLLTITAQTVLIKQRQQLLRAIEDVI